MMTVAACPTVPGPLQPVAMARTGRFAPPSATDHPKPGGKGRAPFNTAAPPPPPPPLKGALGKGVRPPAQAPGASIRYHSSTETAQLVSRGEGGALTRCRGGGGGR